MQIKTHLLVAASRCDFDMQNNCQQIWFWVKLFGRGHHREFSILQLCDSKECVLGRLKCCSGGSKLLCSRATSRVQRAGRKIAEPKEVPKHTPRQHTPRQHMPRQHMPRQHMPLQHLARQHMPPVKSATAQCHAAAKC